jgi:hypothetical protein
MARTRPPTRIFSVKRKKDLKLNKVMDVSDTGPNLDAVLVRLDSIEAALSVLIKQRTVQDWYSTAEAAGVLGKAEFTVREWCRLGRVHAEKRGSGRGKYQSWVLSHAELQRIQKEGLLPRRPD